MGKRDKTTSKSDLDDAYILNSLFDGNAGVQGAVCHDSIIDQSGQELILVEQQGVRWLQLSYLNSSDLPEIIIMFSMK